MMKERPAARSPHVRHLTEDGNIAASLLRKIPHPCFSPGSAAANVHLHRVDSSIRRPPRNLTAHRAHPAPGG
ncbi:protein of unknown function [Burkholderia multivorans]